MFVIQAIKGNCADVSAKDSSQETCVNLTATLISLIVLSMVTSNMYVYIFISFNYSQFKIKQYFNFFFIYFFF